MRLLAADVDSASHVFFLYLRNGHEARRERGTGRGVTALFPGGMDHHHTTSSGGLAMLFASFAGSALCLEEAEGGTLDTEVRVLRRTQACPMVSESRLVSCRRAAAENRARRSAVPMSRAQGTGLHGGGVGCLAVWPPLLHFALDVVILRPFWI